MVIEVQVRRKLLHFLNYLFFVSYEMVLFVCYETTLILKYFKY